MRKGTLFLSAVLTAFMLAVLVGVASAYQRVAKGSEAAAQPPAPAAAVSQVASQPLAVAAAPAFTPDQAAALAGQVIGRTDLYSVETSDLNGQSAYLVTFSSGDLVYVSLDGQILSISHIVPQVVSASPVRRLRDHSGGNNTPPLPPTGGDDGHDDHDNHED
jgi:hypothetical protein